jgi:YidC/Oxa1 family membrane protein insertase
MKAHNVKPFASYLSLLIQLPIFIALYAVFLREGFPAIAEQLMYSFTPRPEYVGAVFLGVLDLTTTKHLFMAVLVAGLQFVQAYLSMGGSKKMQKSAPANPPRPERAQIEMIQKQMLYILPVVMGVVAFTAPAAAALYLLANAAISILQEFLVRRRIDAEYDAKTRELQAQGQ